MRRAGKRATCQALDEDGARCRRKTWYSEEYHGALDVGQRCTWVRVHLCDLHSYGGRDD